MNAEKGKQYNYLTFIDYVKKNGRTLCLCECTCGKQVIVQEQQLLSGRRKSCGCARTNAMDKYASYVDTYIGNWYIRSIQRQNGVCYAQCRCQCGTQKNVNIYNLLNGQSKDCGCGRKETIGSRKAKDLVGQRFGRLLVEECLGSNKYKRRVYRCKCDCGNTTVAVSSLLLDGRIHSCGCLLSYYNSLIDQILQEKGVDHISEYPIEVDGKRLRFDFYLPQSNAVIEYDGEQHYMPVNFGHSEYAKVLADYDRNVRYDKLKNDYCQANGIRIIRIPYWEKNNIKTIINNYLQRLNEKGAGQPAYVTV